MLENSVQGTYMSTLNVCDAGGRGGEGKDELDGLIVDLLRHD